MAGNAKERWASGDLYEPYVGRWSRLVARDFLKWLDAPAGLDWLDVGCGTGALAEAIGDGFAPNRLAGIDPSAGFLGFAKGSAQLARSFGRPMPRSCRLRPPSSTASSPASC
jgi:SAM-dependent methyltransferase